MYVFKIKNIFIDNILACAYNFLKKKKKSCTYKLIELYMFSSYVCTIRKSTNTIYKISLHFHNKLFLIDKKSLLRIIDGLSVICNHILFWFMVDWQLNLLLKCYEIFVKLLKNSCINHQKKKKKTHAYFDFNVLFKENKYKISFNWY